MVVNPAMLEEDFFRGTEDHTRRVNRVCIF